MGDDTRLACPNCGGTKLSWTFEMVEFGEVIETESGSVLYEGAKTGEVIGSSDDVFCTSCNANYERPELLVPEDEVDDGG